MTRPAHEVSVVIVNYNTADFTAQCLDSIGRTPPEASLEIVVVDNASDGDDAGTLERRYPAIRLIRSPRNVGIAGGNNLGMEATAGCYVLLLNNDTVVQPGTIDRLVEFLDDHPHAGGAAGTLLNGDKSFQSSYFDFPSLRNEFLFVTQLGPLLDSDFPSHPPPTEVCEINWTSTAFALFRRDAMASVGMVDEEYFIYSDETDLQYRMRQAGWRMYCLPDVETVHFGGKSLTPWRRRRMLYRGKLLFFGKHYGLFRTAALRVMFGLLSGIKVLFWTVASLVPSLRDRAGHERASHIEIVRLCLRLE